MRFDLSELAVDRREAVVVDRQEVVTSAAFSPGQQFADPHIVNRVGLGPVAHHSPELAGSEYQVPDIVVGLNGVVSPGLDPLANSGGGSHLEEVGQGLQSGSVGKTTSQRAWGRLAQRSRARLPRRRRGQQEPRDTCCRRDRSRGHSQDHGEEHS